MGVGNVSGKYLDRSRETGGLIGQALESVLRTGGHRDIPPETGEIEGELTADARAGAGNPCATITGLRTIQ
ncbi:hypothetical protein GCM10011316_15820 [Roseibium aquae]|uniref:Uncharacterized protein n=1 Tax=Roseibium aquae TaxID=1323746 RepID=A0A916TGY8_9HYPH|nr:hypothetical protein GCM10011316_15820 [Roseibium aquae]